MSEGLKKIFADKKRLLIVANRLPYQFIDKKGLIIRLPGPGGVITGIADYIKKKESETGGRVKAIWIGTPDLSESTFNVKNEGFSKDQFAFCPVFLPSEVYDRHYNGFCNDTLWQLFHNFPDNTQFNEADYQAYVTANQLFCEKIVQEYRKGDVIWIHDYHLMLLPALLRSHLPSSKIGFFLHIPFPPVELYRKLPLSWRKDLLNGLLGTDLIGFDVNDSLNNFLITVQDLAGYDVQGQTIIFQNRKVVADVSVASVDYEMFNKAFTIFPVK